MIDTENTIRSLYGIKCVYMYMYIRTCIAYTVYTCTLLENTCVHCTCTSAGHGYKIWSRVTELSGYPDTRPINAIYV